MAQMYDRFLKYSWDLVLSQHRNSSVSWNHAGGIDLKITWQQLWFSIFFGPIPAALQLHACVLQPWVILATRLWAMWAAWFDLNKKQVKSQGRLKLEDAESPICSVHETTESWNPSNKNRDPSLKWHETPETTGKRKQLEISWRMNLQVDDSYDVSLVFSQDAQRRLGGVQGRSCLRAHAPWSCGKEKSVFWKKKKNKSERPSIWKFQNILDLPQFKETASLNPLTSPKSDGAQTQGWQWSPCRSRWSVEPEQETTSSPPHPDQPKRFKKGTCPTWSNWAQNIISFFHLDLRFIDMSNDILFIILFFSLWPECHFILDFWKRINDRVAFTQASIYQTLASGFKTNLQAADQTTPQTLPQVPLAPQVEGKIPSCLG